MDSVYIYLLIWGCLHGLYLVIERNISIWKPAISPQSYPFWRQILGMGGIFTLTILAWVPFRWNLPAAFEFWRALFNWSDFGIHYRRLYLILPILFVSLIIDFLQYKNQDELIFLKWSPLAKAVCMAIIVFLVLITTGGDFGQPFVYQEF